MNTIAGMPARIWGPPTGSVLLAVHGAHGDKQDATIRRVAAAAVPLGYQVVSVDLPGHGDRTDVERLRPWFCVPELAAVHDALTESGAGTDLFACSLGAYFSLLALADRRLGRTLLLSPLVDMDAHIARLMRAHSITEGRLQRELTIALPDGQFLDWRYRTYAHEHPVRWPHPTDLLRGSHDEVVPETDIAGFAAASRVRVQRIDAGHAFTAAHDPVVDAWLTASLARSDRVGGERL
jgi:pimeloyl-ACP methyl ester carboxylesterase